MASASDSDSDSDASSGSNTSRPWINNLPTAPLHRAACFGNAEAVRRLLAAGHDPNESNEQSFLLSPLFYACAVYGTATPREDYAGCVKALLGAGARVNVVDNSNGRTPLHYVHRVWDAERIVKMLISAGADVNVRGAPFPYTSGGVPLLDMDPDYSRFHPDVVMSRRITPLLLRAGASMYYIYGPPYYNPYLQKIYDMCPGDCSKRFKAYEKRHADALVATFVPKLRLPPEMIRHVVFYWAHVGFY